MNRYIALRWAGYFGHVWIPCIYLSLAGYNRLAAQIFGVSLILLPLILSLAALSVPVQRAMEEREIENACFTHL